jgi:uncharacterized membrane protein
MNMEKQKFKGISINPELPIVLIVTFILLLGGLSIIVFGDKGEFNFYSSKIVVNGQNIQEELHYKPDKPYHTLYRNFESEVYGGVPFDPSENYFIINKIQCSSGYGYVKDTYGNCKNFNFDNNVCFSYTENNEYGCTFGNELGFLEGKEYTINSEYEIHPENLFKIDNKYYIKFVAYSPGNHVKLTAENFIVEGEVVKDERYLTNQNAILYLPYNGDITGFNIIEKKDFEFDSGFKFILKYFLLLFPGIFFFLIWFIFGKENTYEQTPKELSSFPSKRVFWEVAAYFNPPFLRLDKNFFAATLLNFYNKKIIDIKDKEKEIYIKLNKFEGDHLECQIYNILVEAEKLLKDEIKKGPLSGGYLWKKDKKNLFDGEYFNFKKAMLNPNLRSIFLVLKDNVKEEGKKYLHDNHAMTILIVVLSCLFVYFINFYIYKVSMQMNMDLLYAMLFVVFIFTIPLTRGTLFSKYKENYYIEYQKWKAFKRYLKNSFSIKTATHKTVAIWNEYLVYATALGVPDKVINELKASNLINERQMNIYNGVILASSASFSSASGGAGGGGFGGAGGGGAGGGGGGGR